MLRIKHRNAPDTVLFVHDRIRRSEAKEKAAEHLKFWSITEVGKDENGQPINRRVAPEEWIFEWYENGKAEPITP